MKPWRVFGFYALPVVLLAALLGVFAFLGARLTGGAAPLSLPDTLPAGIMVQPGAILGGQALRIGEAIANGTTPATAPGLQRPVGSFVYTRNGATAFVKSGTAATAWSAFTGGGGGTSIDAAISRAQQLVGFGASMLCWRDEYIYNPNTIGINQLVGSGAAGTTAGQTVGGRFNVASGATANSYGVHTTANTIFGRPDVNKFYFQSRIAVQTAIDAQSGVGVGACNNNLTFSWLVGVCGNISTTNYTFQRDGAPPCLGLIVDTGVPFVIGTLATVEVWGLGDGFYHVAINLTEIAGSPVTVSGSMVDSLRGYIQAKNGTTAANRSLDVDYYMACWSQP